MTRQATAETLIDTMTTTDIAQLFKQVCEEAKGQEIVGLDIRRQSDITDYLIVASGRSDRHVQGLANRILAAAERQGMKPVSVEGFDRGHWILIDFADVVVHLFYDTVREHYALESLWPEAGRIQ